MGAVSGPSGSAYIEAAAANRAKEQEIRRAYGYTDRDHVVICTLPKNQIGKKYGSRFYKPMSLRAQRLQESVYILKGKILSAENSDLAPGEKRQKLRELRCELKYMKTKLSSEIASLPRVGIIVLDEDA